MDIIELGKRIKYTRKKLLKISQKSLATQINTHQVMISRLEKGRGASVDLVLNICDYFQAKGIKAHYLFSEPYDYDFFLIRQIKAQFLSTEGGTKGDALP
jgi:transcriptional regulator with XRE-family HTH domain